MLLITNIENILILEGDFVEGDVLLSPPFWSQSIFNIFPPCMNECLGSQRHFGFRGQKREAIL